jgi:hypothetical protein
VQIEIINDSLYELTERIVLYIKSVSNNNLGYPRIHVIYITDNDVPPIVFIDIDPYADDSISEDGGSLVIPVLLSGQSGAPVNVNFSVESSADGPEYYFTPDTGWLNFPINYSDPERKLLYTTSAITIFPIDDLIRTSDRTIEITLIYADYATIIFDPPSDIYPHTHTVTILDNDANLCGLSYLSSELTTNAFTVNIENSGIDVILSSVSVNITYGDGTVISYLTSVSLKGSPIWVGSVDSTSDIADIPSVDYPWIVEEANRTIQSGSTNSITLQFDPGVDAIKSMSLDFGVCGVVSYSDP